MQTYIHIYTVTATERKAAYGNVSRVGGWVGVVQEQEEELRDTSGWCLKQACVMAEGVEIDGVGHGAGWGGKETFVRYDDEGTEDERVLDEQERKKRARNDRRNERRRLARKLKREARDAMAKAVAEGDVELVGEDDALAIEGLFNLANSTGEHAHNAGAHRDSSVSPRKNRRKRKKKGAEDETTHARASAGADATQKTKKKRKRTKWKLDANNIPRLPGGADIDLQLLKKTVMENGGYHRCCEVSAHAHIPLILIDDRSKRE